MKKVFAFMASVVIATSLGTISSSSANAVDCQAFNMGTYQAFHVAGADGAGLYKIASACHPG